MMEDITSLGKTMGMQVDEEDNTDITTENSVEMTMKELKELHEQQHSEVLQKIHREETEAEEVSVRSSNIKEVLAMWVKFSH